MTTARTLTETDLYHSYWDEGLLDLLAGAALLIAGIGWASDLGALAVIQMPLWIVLWTPLRRKVVEPRAGFVRFSLSRRKRNTRRLRETLALGVGALALVALVPLLLSGRDAGPDGARLIAGLPAVLVAIAAFLGGVLTGAGRFLLYGLALTVAAVATVGFAGGPALPLAAVGLVVVTAGAVLLTRFLRESRAYGDPS